MEYRAEIFDRMQLFYDETGFNDHQVHAEIRLQSRLDEERLRKAVTLSLQSIPILATRYVAAPGRSRWESLPEADLERAFAAAGDETAFESGRTYRIREEEGPQLRLCLLRGERSALAVTMNHMIADGAGFKDYLYFLCDIYSRLGGRGRGEPGPVPAAKIDGYRGIADVTRAFGPGTKLRAWFAQRGDSNRTGKLAFPFDSGGELHPFIATRIVDRDKVARLKDYCKARGATLNDAALAAYYRVLARVLGPPALEGLEVPIMIDMRRHLPSREFAALRNLASTAVTRLRQSEGEDFEATLSKAKSLMDGLKRRNLGLGGYLKMSLLFSLFGERKAESLLRAGLRHPLLCMTNLGDLDAKRLVFEGCSVASTYVCGSIKHKPHFQLALSGFDGTITLSSNLYGSARDREKVDAFLAEVEEELSCV
ncbi:MAG: hypothetical protein ACLQMF_15190 [Rectinemataceae bacterium]